MGQRFPIKAKSTVAALEWFSGDSNVLNTHPTLD
jgi:hypothetical protein